MKRPEDPRDRIMDELNRRDWTQQMFSDVIGRPPQSVSEILNGKKQITPITAMQFGAALDTPAEEWLHLQADYNIWALQRTSSAGPMLDLIRERAKRAKPRARPETPNYTVEWDGRKHVATVDTHPELKATAGSAEYALRKLRKQIADARRQA